MFQDKRAAVPWQRLTYLLSFVAPGVLVYACFVLAPIMLSFGYSLTNASLFNARTSFVGLDNYLRLLTDPDFLTSLKVTTILTLIVVIVPNVAGGAGAGRFARTGGLSRGLRRASF